MYNVYDLKKFLSYYGEFMFFLVFIILFTAKTAFSEELLTRTKIIMETYITVKLPEDRKELFEPAFEIFKDIDRKLSIYKESSEISILNKRKKHRLSDETLEALKRSIQICKETEGYFDITVGKITSDLFRFGFDDERVPEEKDLEVYKRPDPCSGIRIKGSYVEIDKDIKLDPGGMGKGYAVDLVYRFLKEKGVKKGVILASGDIRCIDRCVIYIKDPYGEGEIVRFRTKNDGTAVSTSGIYERFIKSKDNNHLINPKTGKPQKKKISVTLLWYGDNTELDGYTTAVSVMPLEKALNFLKSRGIGYILFLDNNRVILSKNIDSFVEDLRFLKSGVYIIKK
ncbi:MAG TPA: FAD:protein FMN transferase [Persephonella sp.]|nr:FAD:protein FMN transferase [Persephonella sp.]